MWIHFSYSESNCDAWWEIYSSWNNFPDKSSGSFFQHISIGEELLKFYPSSIARVLFLHYFHAMIYNPNVNTGRCALCSTFASVYSVFLASAYWIKSLTCSKYFPTGSEESIGSFIQRFVVSGSSVVIFLYQLMRCSTGYRHITPNNVVHLLLIYLI